MTTTPDEPLSDNDIETEFPPETTEPVGPGGDADGTDGDASDGDGTDGDGTDGDASDSDGTDGTDGGA